MSKTTTTTIGKTTAQTPPISTASPHKAAKPLWFVFIENVVWATIALVIILAGLELVFRLAHVGEEEFVQITPVVGFWHAPNRLVTWRSEGYSQSFTNSDGMRDVEYSVVKPVGVRRIAVLGDSMTEGYQVEPQDTFVKQLERKLNNSSSKVQVMNFGMSGFSTVQGLYLFKEKIAKYKPDMCILAYHVNDNDKNTNSFGIDKSLPRPYCFVSPSGNLMTDWQSYDDWQHSPAADLYRSTAALRSSSRLWAVWTKIDLQLGSLPWYGQLKGLLPHKNASSAVVPPRQTDTGIDVTGATYKAPLVPSPAAAFGNNAASPTTAPLSPSTQGSTKASTMTATSPVPKVHVQLPASAEAVDATSKQQRAVEKNRLIAKQWRQSLEISQRHFEVTAAVIGELKHACDDADCKFMVAALPAPNNSMMFFRELLSLRPVAKQLDFAFVDINDAFPSLAPMQESPLYYRIHYTPEGHSVVANRLQAALKQNGFTR